MTATANEIRGEVSIDLDGVAYVLRPSYEAGAAIEQATGRSLMELAVAADASRMPLSQMSIVVTEYIKAWGRETGNTATEHFEAKRIGELIHDGAGGILAAMPRVALVLTRAVSGGCRLGEQMAAGTTTETTTTATPAAD